MRMFCPKCGSKNGDETKFCRSCGAELSNVLAAMDAKKPAVETTLEEKYISVYSRGVRGLLIGLGFLVISGVIFSRPPIGGIFWLFPFAFAALILGTGISRFVQAKGLKALIERQNAGKLPPAKTELIEPSRSLYDTDNLSTRPPSVTERTTNHLEIDTKIDR